MFYNSVAGVVVGIPTPSRVNQSVILSGLTVIIIGQEETTTTSDPSTATLLHIRLPHSLQAQHDSLLPSLPP